MGRGWKILIAAVAIVAVLLVVNALLVDNATKGAEVTVAGGTLIDVDGTEVQVLEKGPRDGSPVVLVHCYTCAIDWWAGMIPLLARNHRVIALDLRGFGGSEKPDSGYSIPEQAALVAGAMDALEVSDATVVGHSLGGTVTTALAEEDPELVDRAVIVDQAPDSSFESEGLPFTATLTFVPVLGPALWRVTPDFAIENGISVAFAPGFDVPEEFIDDFRRMTYTSYDSAPEAENEYSDATPLDQRLRKSGLPVMAIFGAEEQLYDPEKSLAAYAKLPDVRIELVKGAGHSPNVEKPGITAALVSSFMQEGVQKANPVRRGP